MSKYVINDTTLTSIADAVREKAGTSEAIVVSDLPQAIRDIPSGGGGGGNEPTVEDLTFTGSQDYRFKDNQLNWIIERYADRIVTRNLQNPTRMFMSCDKLEELPIELNFYQEGSSTVSPGYMFYNCKKLKALPTFNNFRPNELQNFMPSCMNVRDISDFAKNIQWNYIDGLTSAYSGGMYGMLSSCYSLRTIPTEILSHGNPYSYSSYHLFHTLDQLYSLDEIVNALPPGYKATWTSNGFSSSLNGMSRCKDFTFALTEEGVPYTVKWKSQTINLSSYFGYAVPGSALVDSILNYNSGITADKEVKDAATYEALKNDPDWFATDVAYSRYNHDSAVRTINSLPDTSAYLATAGGTNTIKFKGAAGSATDGGAINTLTAEEIAVATAKGWTVTLV